MRAGLPHLPDSTYSIGVRVLDSACSDGPPKPRSRPSISSPRLSVGVAAREKNLGSQKNCNPGPLRPTENSVIRAGGRHADGTVQVASARSRRVAEERLEAISDEQLLDRFLDGTTNPRRRRFAPSSSATARWSWASAAISSTSSRMPRMHSGHVPRAGAKSRLDPRSPRAGALALRGGLSNRDACENHSGPTADARKAGR